MPSIVEAVRVGSEQGGWNSVGRQKGSGRMKTSLAGLIFTLMVGMMSDSTARTDSTKTTLVFISSFAAGAEGAIGAFHLDPAAGTLTPAHRTSGVEHPFFLALSPDRRFLYSIQARQFGGTENEHVAAYAISGAG